MKLSNDLKLDQITVVPTSKDLRTDHLTLVPSRTIVSRVDQEILEASKKLLKLYQNQFSYNSIEKFETNSTCDSLVSNSVGFKRYPTLILQMVKRVVLK